MASQFASASGSNNYIQCPMTGLKMQKCTERDPVQVSEVEALGLEVTKVPSKSADNLDKLEIARELDKLSAKLDGVDDMISSTIPADLQVQSLLSGTADVWMPVITANTDERLNCATSSIKSTRNTPTDFSLH
ncbi:hypothetical protein DITRI_Ditri18aG0018300 [Diplodiscus trichospermus]